MTDPYDPQVKTPTVSVVIATRGRRDRLQETLVPLLAEPAADEIVVVDDGSNDGSLKLLEDLAAAHPQLRPVPTRLPARCRPGDASTYLYAGNYEGSCAACERDRSLVLTGLWGGNVSICRADALRVGMDSSFTYHEDRDFGLRCMKAGLSGRFDRSLHAEHVHARNVATLRRDARGQGAGRVKIHRVHAEVLPPFDGRRFACDLPASLGCVVVACWRPRVGTFCARGLAAAGRLRLWRVETNLVKLLRRVELQRGALDAAEHS
jgi:glycosyltransferase involved in cell wall biosynthesis